MSSLTSKSVFSNFIWRFLERFGAQIVTLIVSIVLARILDPEIYGLVALVTVITTLLQVFVDSGLGNALIQKKNSDDTDFSTVFYFNLLLCLVLYVILFLAAPLIASFYKSEILTPVIRVLGITLIISGVKNVQQAYVFKNFLFKRFFFSTLGGTIAAAVVGIILAVYGYGVWALVAQYLVNLTVDTLILWITVHWRPKLLFSISRLKGLYSYGWKLLVSSIIEAVYTDIRKLIIGKLYTSEDLAFYNKGEEFPRVIAGNVTSSIDSILLPAMAHEQDNKERVRNMTRRAIKTSAYLIWPLMIGLGVCAESFVSLVLTDKWLFCVPYLRIFCFIYAFYPIHTANLNAIKALGRSDIYLKLEIIKKVIGIAVLLSTMWFGVDIMAYSLLLTTVLSVFINSFPNKKLLSYTYLDQIRDILPAALLSVVMGAIVYCVNFISLPDWIIISIQVPLGVVIYVMGSILFKFESFKYCCNLFKSFFKKNKSGEKQVADDDATLQNAYTKEELVDNTVVAENSNEKNSLKETNLDEDKMKKKRLLLLGGSRFLLPVIKVAHDLGLYVITCDYLPDNIAHKYSDEYINISIINKEEVLEVARSLGIDGIMSFACDPGVTTAAYVAEQLGLPSCGSYESVCILQDKAKFRSFLTENGFNVPKAKGYSNINDALADINYFKWPIIVKPTDSAGSKGVSRVNNPDDLIQSVENAIKFSLSGSFIIEEFIEKRGCSSDTDSFSVNGNLEFISFSSQMFDVNAVNPYTPAAYSWPSTFTKENEAILKSELQRLLSLLKMRTSIYNIETRESIDGEPYIMEVSPRGGGNRLAEMLHYATGVDLIQYAVKAAVGIDVSDIEQRDYNGCWAEYILHSDKAGVFDSLSIEPKFEQQHIVEKDLWVKKGDKVREFTGANETIGTLVLRFENKEEMSAYMASIKNYVNINLL